MSRFHRRRRSTTLQEVPAAPKGALRKVLDIQRLPKEVPAATKGALRKVVDIKRFPKEVPAAPKGALRKVLDIQYLLNVVSEMFLLKCGVLNILLKAVLLHHLSH